MLTSPSHKDSTASLGISGAIGLGPIRLTALALGSAACGSLGSLYDFQKTAAAGLPEPRGLGASGMVQGVMMATMLAQPRWPVSFSQVYNYFFLIERLALAFAFILPRNLLGLGSGVTVYTDRKPR